ncbi:Protein of unknown function [Rhizobiales bacterium GAS191]|nr:Protein of unknown function [Rhizobiales bacterium GAS191]
MSAARREAADRALETGHLLIEAKAECHHGEWLPFLKRAGLAERQAQRLMTLARSGLKSDTVSDLGIRAALDMASKRKLPKADGVLIVSVGEWSGTPALPWPRRWRDDRPPFGEITAYVYSISGSAQYQVVLWRDHPPGSEPAATTIATRRAIPSDRQDVVFSTVDMMLDGRQSDMRFSVLDPNDDELVNAVVRLHGLALEDAAAHRVMADALEIESMAKCRLADEVETTLQDLGLTPQDIHEARIIRDAEIADPGIVRRVLDEKLERGEEPTRAAVMSAIVNRTSG